MSVYKSRGPFLPLYLCAGSRSHTPAAALGGIEEEAKTQDYQSNAKTEARGAKGQGGLTSARALLG